MSDNSSSIFLEDIRLIVDDLKEFHNELEGKTVLIAGGKGFLGTYFTNVLIKINEVLSTSMKIVVMDNMITSKNKENNSNITFLEHDISKNFDFDGDLDYYAGGSTDSDSVEYEGPGGGHKYDTIYKEMVKFRKNFDKVLKKALNDYKKAWK